MEAKLDRRDFLKGAAVSAAGIGVASMLGACTPQQSGGDEPEATAPATSTTDGDLILNAELADSKWSFEIPPDPIPDSDIKETVEAEIVVVGAGTSGLCTAVSAAEQGADVLLISASKAPVSRGGSNHAINSKVMEREGVEPYDLEKFMMRERILAANSVDQKKWSKLFNNNEEAMNWLIDLMEERGIPMTLETCAPEVVFGPDDPQFIPLAAHGAYSEDYDPGSGQPLIVNALAEILQEKGGRILFETKGVQLIRDDDNTGRVSAIIAQDLNTEEYTKYAASKAIVLATGDFSADKEMMKKYCPSMLPLIADDAGEDYDVGPATTGLYKGDGHKMGLWIGAGWQRNVPNCPMVNVQQGTAAQPYCGHCGLTLNINGERYSNEHATHSYTGRALMLQPGQVSFPIWATNYASEYGPWYARGAFDLPEMTTEEVIADWEDKVESGRFVKADTLEELVELLELPKETALASIERYNELCEKGHDDDFFKRADQMVPVRDAPFYGARVGGRFLTVMGGLRTNVDLQVCQDDDTPIEGLYVVGTMVGDFFNNTYTFLMEGLNYGGCCVTFGYVLGRELAAK